MQAVQYQEGVSAIAWFKVDDQLHSHPKARRAGLEAMGLWLLAGSHCMSYLTDGFVEAWFVQSWPHGEELAGKLVQAGLWLEADGGWQFHDWEKFQPTRESVKADRHAAAERMRRVRANRKGGSGEQGSNVPESFGDGSPTPSPSPSPSPETDLTSISSQSANPLAVDNLRTDSIQESEEQIAGARALAATQKLDLEKIRQLASERCGRDLGFGEALRLGNLIVSKSRVRVSKPTAYVVRAFNEPFEVQQLIDKEVRT